ncbi:CLUMA_CG009804, isoform A [Clunio marinus]|uniref:CLUMA_CG009804, isoform A n=1 Tax=Clunio marinus TaxID=568069 RepID=A0A1J1I847_9DIPT|nr:CLUMA_CG009804, isoform A [Clunio marinus]
MCEEDKLKYSTVSNISKRFEKLNSEYLEKKPKKFEAPVRKIVVLRSESLHDPSLSSHRKARHLKDFQVQDSYTRKSYQESKETLYNIKNKSSTMDLLRCVQYHESMKTADNDNRLNRKTLSRSKFYYELSPENNVEDYVDESARVKNLQETPSNLKNNLDRSSFLRSDINNLDKNFGTDSKATVERSLQNQIHIKQIREDDGEKILSLTNTLEETELPSWYRDREKVQRESTNCQVVSRNSQHFENSLTEKSQVTSPRNSLEKCETEVQEKDFMNNFSHSQDERTQKTLNKESFLKEIVSAPFSSEHEKIIEDVTKLSKIDKIIHEILESEINYITQLENGINSYFYRYDKEDLPIKLKGQKKHIFSNIVDIHKFHKFELLPKLRSCGNDYGKIANTFVNLIERRKFNLYVIYVPCLKRAQSICIENEAFFKQLQRDRLGIKSFILLPVQRLSRYKLLFGKLAEASLEYIESDKNSVAACCLAEKKLQKVLEYRQSFMEIRFKGDKTISVYQGHLIEVIELIEVPLYLDR